MGKINSVYEFAWLTTQQIVVTSDKKGLNIKGYGSGFFFQYKDRLFFVTADHVSHPDDFEQGIRLGKDDFVWVFNNQNSTTELATMLTPIGGLFSFDRSDLLDELSIEIPDMEDVSFAILPNSFKYPFLTHELRVEENVIVPAGEEKIIVQSACATELKESDYCLVEGCVQWNDSDGVRLFRCNAIHQDLTLKQIDDEGNYIMKYIAPIVYKDWAGLSGGPVFTDSGRLIGMITDVNENDDTILVVPMKKITRLMDYAIKYEEDIKQLEEKKD